MIRVLLADDHTILRAGLRSLVDSMADIRVVAEASTGPETLDLVEEHRPDVALLDISMPGMTGIDVAARLAITHPTTRVVILSMHREEAFVQRAIRGGAKGYLLKDSDPSELERAIRAVAEGETYFCSKVANYLVADYLRQGSGEPEATERLTGRQLEVLRLMAEGHNTKSIARTLGISAKTVETHRAQLMERLHIHEVAGLVRYAIRVGIVDADA